MKLLTLNVHAWLEANQAEKIEILAETIVEKGYEIIALQSINALHKNIRFFGAIRILVMINMMKALRF